MPDTLAIHPVERPIDVEVSLPGSKSITNRALIVAALARGSSLLESALFSDDTRYMAAALQSLGIHVSAREVECVYEVNGTGGNIPSKSADIFVGNAGTAARFLTAYLALGHGTYRLDGVPRMRQRPIGDLLTALQTLGVQVHCEHDNGCPPIIMHADGLRGGDVSVRADISSQYLSALLLVAPCSQQGIDITVEGDLSSEPYIDITLRVMRQWGAMLETRDHRYFHIPGNQNYQNQTYAIEPDASGASYFFAAAAVTGGRVRVQGLGQGSMQGDLAFTDVLEKMGCTVEQTDSYTEVHGPEKLHGVDVNMNAISDTVMTLAAIAPFADGATIIRGVGHIRQKETDRITALVNELRKIGAEAEEKPDGIIIYPPENVLPAGIDTYDDHRMAMSFAITGLKAQGIVIKDPDCVAKTFPDFFRRLRLACYPE
jgi:3-phosphoshikimate 1-carboxyvinyltransferase